MRRAARGVKHQRPAGLVDAQLLEAEILVDSGEDGAADGAILVQQQPRAKRSPVVIEGNRAFQVAQRLDRPVVELLANRIVEPRRRIGRVQLLGYRVLRTRWLVASFLEECLAEVRSQQAAAWVVC